MATSLKPLISAMPWSDSLTLKIHPPLAVIQPKLYQSKFACPTLCPKGPTVLRGGWWNPHHVVHGRPSLVTDWHIVLHFHIFSHYGMVLLKVWTLGPQIGENWVFFARQTLGGTYEHPYRTWTISGHTALCGKVLRISAKGRRKICGWKKEITQVKHSIFCYRYSDTRRQ